jgi:transcriptional regulator with XRE-family HTH domain
MASAVAESLNPAAPRLLLGGRLRHMRRRKGMTVDELARAVDVDKAHISRIENNRKSPSIAMLAQLAKALGVSMGHLLGETLDKSEVKVTRAEHVGDAGPNNGGHHRFIPLLHGNTVSSFEAFLAYPVADAGVVEARHGGQEMLYVVSGSIEVVFHNYTVTVSQGDCVHFPGYLHHRLRRVGRRKAVVLVVLSNESPTSQTSMRTPPPPG